MERHPSHGSDGDGASTHVSATRPHGAVHFLGEAAPRTLPRPAHARLHHHSSDSMGRSNDVGNPLQNLQAPPPPRPPPPHMLLPTFAVSSVIREAREEISAEQQLLRNAASRGGSSLMMSGSAHSSVCSSDSSTPTPSAGCAAGPAGVAMRASPSRSALIDPTSLQHRNSSVHVIDVARVTASAGIAHQRSQCGLQVPLNASSSAPTPLAKAASRPSLPVSVEERGVKAALSDDQAGVRPVSPWSPEVILVVPSHANEDSE